MSFGKDLSQEEYDKFNDFLKNEVMKCSKWYNFSKNRSFDY